ncbi:MAG TPA: class I SAM-dependent methyltransferase [Bryobacteraceae bacterium]|nr:class I SAM-dependent methyltransferase [Bryobacteraceae bacterium]
MVQCGGCELIRLHPWPTPDELRAYYPENYWFVPEGTSGKLAQFYRRFVLADHVRFVWRALRESGLPGPVLDVGCGGGLLLAMLRERGARVVGLDLAQAAASVTWNVSGVPAICGSLSRPPIAGQSCAAVTMFHVLEHLYDPAAYLDEARKMLPAEGRLIVQVPNAECWQFLLFGENWNGIDIPRHLLHFRTADLRRLVEDCGFQVIREKHFSWRDNPAGLATTLAPGLDPMARRVRGVGESAPWALAKDVAYLGLTAASWPFTLLEAACRRGSSIMLEARKTP